MQDAIFDALGRPELEILVRYVNKARGWLLVGAGGLLIAVGETYQLVTEYEWSTGVFWCAVIVLFLLSFGNAQGSAQASRAMLARKTE